MKQDLREMQIVLMQFNLELAHDSSNVQEHFLEAVKVVQKLRYESGCVLLLTQYSVK